LAEQGNLGGAAQVWEALADQNLGLSLQTWLLFSAADLYGDSRQWERADVYYQRAVASSTKPKILAQVLKAWGETFWRRNRWDEAEERFQSALLEAGKSGSDTLVVARCLNSLGSVALNRGDLGKAEHYFRRNLAITERFGPSLSLAANLAELGTVALRRGDLAKAEEYYTRDVAITKALAPGSLELAITYNNFGALLEERRDFARAEQYFRRALAITVRIAPGDVGAGFIMGNLGALMEDRGDLSLAGVYYRRALQLKKRTAPGSLTMAGTLSRLGGLAYKRGDLALADQYLRQALTIQERVAPGSLDLAATLSALGRLAAKRGNVQEAHGYQLRALGIRETLAPGSKALAESLASLADIAHTAGDVDGAVTFYEKALHALESQTAQLGGGDIVRSDFRSTYLPYYREFVELLLVKNQPERAFDVLERSRARSLLEMLAGGRVEIKEGVDPAVLNRERSLKSALTAKIGYRINLLTGTHTDAQLEHVNLEIEEISARLEEVERELRATNSAFATLTQPTTLTVREIQELLLDDETVLLEYSLGDPQSHVWVVTANQFTVYRLPSRLAIETVARTLYELLAKRDGWIMDWGRQSIRVHNAALQLSRMLLSQVMNQIRAKRLLIVSDGILQYIPFAVLPEPGIRQVSGKAGRPLMVEHEIVNLPSASVMGYLRRERSQHRKVSKGVAILADPVFSVRDERVRGPSGIDRRSSSTPPKPSWNSELLTRAMRDVGAMDNGVMQLPRLIFSRLEAKRIQELTPATERLTALDFRASRATAISGELSSYRIVHFATHAALDSSHPELSGLILSLVDEHGRPQNGFLGLEDIFNLRLRADLVVLSACKTALGKLVSGEGLLGLTRGFMYAGVPRVVSSLWEVDDRGTAELMGRFYRAMELGRLRPAAALRAAQVQMSTDQRWNAPFYWAGFQIQGEWR
jgi:CHAT domain-containing protein/Tfp pilus assembly protein PilF